LIPQAGGEPEHHQIKDNASRGLGHRLVTRDCYAMTFDQRVRVSFGCVCPDVVVACKATHEE